MEEVVDLVKRPSDGVWAAASPPPSPRDQWIAVAFVFGYFWILLSGV
jgi:hypothetical protein